MKKFKSILMLSLILICGAVLFSACGEKDSSENSENNETIYCELITLNYQEKTIYKGETLELTATISPSNATDKTIIWSSSNTNVATITNGQVYAKAEGTTSITAKTNNNISANCLITVIKNPTDDFILQSYGNGYAITQYVGSETEVIVPESHEGKPIVAIGTGRLDGYSRVPDGFYNIPFVEKIVLPKTIQTINYEAFARCTSLAQIEFQNSSVLSIGYGAFQHCVSLEEIELPDGCKYYEEHLFLGCSNLKKVKINSGIINKNLFSANNSITTIELGNNITKIEDESLKVCINLEHLTIPLIDKQVGYLFGKVELERTCDIFDVSPINTIEKTISCTDIYGKKYYQTVIVPDESNDPEWRWIYKWCQYANKKVLYQYEALQVLDEQTVSIKDSNYFYRVPKKVKFNCYYVPEGLKTLTITNQEIKETSEFFKNLPCEIIVIHKVAN